MANGQRVLSTLISEAKHYIHNWSTSMHVLWKTSDINRLTLKTSSKVVSPQGPWPLTATGRRAVLLKQMSQRLRKDRENDVVTRERSTKLLPDLVMIPLTG